MFTEILSTDVIISNNTFFPHNANPKAKQNIIKFGKQCCAQNQNQLKKLLCEFCDVTHDGSDPNGQTGIFEHKMNTGNAIGKYLLLPGTMGAMRRNGTYQQQNA